jgi:hypothetical protein
MRLLPHGHVCAVGGPQVWDDFLVGSEQFGTNHLGHFALINRIEPLLADNGRLLRCCPRLIASPRLTRTIRISSNRHTTHGSPTADRRRPKSAELIKRRVVKPIAHAIVDSTFLHDWFGMAGTSWPFLFCAIGRRTIPRPRAGKGRLVTAVTQLWAG